MSQFAHHLIDWYKKNKRELPWRESSDAYAIWLSEIILQQTRVAQGVSYYIKFLETFPTVSDLANADEEKVMRLWQGLGYYSRARNLHKGAKKIVSDWNSEFPHHYNELKNIPGIGNYTASAIASFAFNEPHAVVDGNVFRVLARKYGIDTPIDTSAGKKEFETLAQELLDKNSPAIYNQAIMEFGAMHCTPKNPNCNECIFNIECVAFRENRVNELPLKLKKVKIRERTFHYFFIFSDNEVVVNHRHHKDIWQKLFDFPIIETSEEMNNQMIVKYLESCGITTSTENIIWVDETSHILTHQRLKIKFYSISMELKNKMLLNPYFQIVAIDELTNFAFPKPLVDFLKKRGIL